MLKRFKSSVLTCTIIFLGGCASSPSQIPYPAFVQVDELVDGYMASLPGAWAKQLFADPTSRRTGNRVDLPKDWAGTSGGVPGRSMEIFVTAGELKLADIVLGRGGYAYLPAGSLGFNLSAKEGAQILYFVNDSDPDSVIRSPIIIDSGLLEWESTQKVGVSSKELRADPGNGSKTWLLRIATGAALAWESSSADREGYLLTGNQQYSECVNGVSSHGQYAPGGYFIRPAYTISGGPESFALTDSIWFLRETSKGEVAVWPDCQVVPHQEEDLFELSPD